MEKQEKPTQKIETRSSVHEKYYPYPIPFDPEVGMDVFSPTETAPEIPDVDKDFKQKNCYMNNTKLMRTGVEFSYTAEQIQELAKCEEDIIYFIVNYCKIITLKGGIELFKMFQYQKNAIKVVHENRFSIFKFPRQMGKCYVGDTELEVRINNEEVKLTAAQLYALIETENNVDSYTPNYDYEILTEDGFKDFDGITTRKTSELLEIKLSNESTFRVTPDHEVKTTDGIFIKASELSIGDTLGIKDQHIIVSIETLTGEFKVADLISVQDTHSFTVSGIGDIRESCVNDDDMVTLFDNETGEIIEVHIDELQNFLENNQ